MSVRRILALGLIVASAVALTGALGLMLLTTLLRDTAEDLRTSVDEVRLSEEVRVDLLRYVRASDSSVLGHADGERARTEIERVMFGRLSALEAITRAGNRQAVVDAGNLLTRYLAVRRAAEARHSALSDVIREATPALEQALVALSRLSDANVARAQADASTAARWDRWSNTTGGVVVVFLIGFVPLALWWLSARVLRPLITISKAMECYAAGAAETRVPIAGAIELDRIGRSFNALADALQEQHERQATSIAGIAHDLRNPLNALRLATSVAQRDQSPEAMAQAFAIVRRQTERLERMAGDLLDAAHIEAGQLELRSEPCDVREAVVSAFDLYAAAAPTHDLRLDVTQEPVILLCDRLRIEQVVTNLLSNAVKYSPSGTTVEVSLRVTPPKCVITVADQGIGIPTASMRHLFQPFHRVKGDRTDVPGTGLGLSVARRIIERHGGTIDVFSVEGRGSIFRVSLPLPAGTVDFGGDESTRRTAPVHAARPR